MRRFFLTFGYSGLLPKAPGTWGTFAGAVVGYLIATMIGFSTLFLLTILISIVAISEIDKDEKISGEHDNSEIVVDEVAGIWLTFSIVGASLTQSWVLVLLSIGFFRLFDIWKPSIIGRIDTDVKGGLGVMGDDLVAGVVAAICAGGSYQGFNYILTII